MPSPQLPAAASKTCNCNIGGAVLRCLRCTRSSVMVGEPTRKSQHPTSIFPLFGGRPPMDAATSDPDAASAVSSEQWAGSGCSKKNENSCWRCHFHPPFGQCRRATAKLRKPKPRFISVFLSSVVSAVRTAPQKHMSQNTAQRRWPVFPNTRHNCRGSQRCSVLAVLRMPWTPRSPTSHLPARSMTLSRSLTAARTHSVIPA